MIEHRRSRKQINKTPTIRCRPGSASPTPATLSLWPCAPRLLCAVARASEGTRPPSRREKFRACHRLARQQRGKEKAMGTGEGPDGDVRTSRAIWPVTLRRRRVVKSHRSDAQSWWLSWGRAHSRAPGPRGERRGLPAIQPSRSWAYAASGYSAGTGVSRTAPGAGWCWHGPRPQVAQPCSASASLAPAEPLRAADADAGRLLLLRGAVEGVLCCGLA